MQSGAATTAGSHPGPAESGPVPPADSAPREAAPASVPTEPDREAGALPSSTEAADETTAARVRPPVSVGSELTADDMALAVSRLPAFAIGDLFSAVDAGRPLESAFGQLAPYSGERQPGEADAGAREIVTAEPAGLEIRVTAGQRSRTGLVAWPEIAAWLEPGLTPARRQVVIRAAQIWLRFMAANASFRAVGEGSLAVAAEGELRGLAQAAVTAIIGDVRPAAPGHLRQPADDDGTALERISALAAALPAQRTRQRKPVSQVSEGDLIGHPGYKLQPFRVSAPPRRRDGDVEITGRLTAPSLGEPAGQVTFTFPTTRTPDPVVSVIELPQQPLRSLFPEPGTGDGPGEAQAPGQKAGTGAAGPQAGDGQPPAAWPRQHARTTETGDPAGTSAEEPAPAVPAAAAAPADPISVPDDTPTEEDTMPAEPATSHVAEATPEAGGGASGTPPASAPPANGPAGKGSAENGTSQGRPGGQPSDGANLLGELDRVLDAIIKRRRGPAGLDDGARDDFTDIRSAFELLRNALDIGGPADLVTGYAPHPAFAAPTAPPRTAPGPARSAAPGTGEFDDIRSAFADLRLVLDLPAGGRHARGAIPSPELSDSRLLDRAVEEAQACARWYRDTPEWQRISAIGRAARELITAIRDAAKDYWAEIRQDIRVRGFARTLASRVCLAISGTAHLLAGRLERAGRADTRMWRAARGLHRATATYADRIMQYTPPGQAARVRDARRIIGDLDARQRQARTSAGTPAGQAPNPVSLARTSFTTRSPRPSTVPATEPVHRAGPAAGQRRNAGQRV
jgi:hypothetical protein